MCMLKELFMGKSPMKEEPKKKISLVLKDDAVTTNTIKDKAVTFKKFSDDAVGNIRDMIDSTVNADKNSIANLTYYECATASQDAIKSVETPYYYLTVGGAMRIKMLHSNSYEGTVKLKVGNAEAQTLFYNGAAISSSNTWDAGETLVVYFDGNVYQAIGIDSLIEKHISSAETNFHEYVDNVAATIQQSIDAIVNSDDTEAINTIGEIATFLEGISNTTTLTALLNAEKEAREQGDATLNSKMGTLANNIAYNKDSLQHSIDNVDAKIAPLEESVNDVSSRLDTVEGDVDSIKDIIGTSEEEGTLVERINEMENLIDGKVDKEEGKSLIDEDYAEDVYYDDSLQYMKVITDADGAILWAITKTGDIKYGYGIPSDIKNYIDTQLAAEVERASAAEQLMLENRIIEVYELPDASKETLDHIYLYKSSNLTEEEKATDKYVTVSYECVRVKTAQSGGQAYTEKFPIVGYYTDEYGEISYEAKAWVKKDSNNPNTVKLDWDPLTPAPGDLQSPGNIFMNKSFTHFEINGTAVENIPLYVVVQTSTYPVNRGFAPSDLEISYGYVFHNEVDSHDYVLTKGGWKLYDRNFDNTFEEDVAAGNVDETIPIDYGYRWELLNSGAFNSKSITVKETSFGHSTISEEYDEDNDVYDMHINNDSGKIMFDAEVVMDSFSTENLEVGAGITVDGINLIPQQSIQVTATGQSMDYQVSLANGERRNIFFTHHPDDVGNTQHTVFIDYTISGLIHRSPAFTFQANTYLEICVTRIGNEYYIREVS